ncbi:hypothetical protein BDQ17DRAFT_1393465 [Cyathus striatus]|nr:hypothetical protein BDQ17DRAFT_1393465 [Cyathus striatus]
MYASGKHFYAAELLDLTRVLQIPPSFITKSSCDQNDLTMLYQCSQAAISEVVNELSLFLDNIWGHLLGLENNNLLIQDKLAFYADTNFQAGALMKSIYGFIDCTICPMCYNGYKKVHALGYQVIKLPDGMTGHVHRPEVGCHNDNCLLAHSGLFQIISPFTGLSPRTEQEKEWNRVMASFHIEVEHDFGNHQIYRSPLGIYYCIGILLTNAQNCLCPNQTSQYFNCEPPH